MARDLRMLTTDEPICMRWYASCRSFSLRKRVSDADRDRSQKPKTENRTVPDPLITKR